MSNKPRVWGTISNVRNKGEFEIISLEDADVQEALDILESFFLNECVCIGTEINLPESAQARKELRELCRIVSEDRVSLVARHVPTNKIAAVSFNKIQYIDDNVEVPFFIEFRDKQCKSPNAINLMSYMIDIEQMVDPFEMYNIDCLMELMFLATLPEFGRKGLASTLAKYTIELSRELNQGIGVEKIDKNLRDKRPKAVTALFTSNFSQKVGRANNFKVLNRVAHSQYSYKGKPYSERIGPMHADTEQVAFLL